MAEEMVRCDTCKGTGIHRVYDESCVVCQGSGEIPASLAKFRAEFRYRQERKLVQGIPFDAPLSTRIGVIDQ